MRTIRFVLMAALILIESAPSLAEQSRCFAYTGGSMTMLGTLGGLECNARAINQAGQVVGSSELAPGQGTHAFLATGGVMTDLGTLGGISSAATDVNDSGQVVGASQTSGGEWHAFLYEAGVMTDLGTLPGALTSQAFHINNAGQVAGWSIVPGNGYHAFLYSGGSMTDLGTLGGLDSFAHDINEAGQVVGHSFDADGDRRAFVYEAGVMMDLGTLGGDWSVAVDINEAGHIVGYSETSDGDTHAYLYDSGVMTDLGALPTSSEGYGISINDAGQIAGISMIGGDAHAFLYESGTMTDLGAGNAVEVNASGQVLVTATTSARIHDGMAVTTLDLIEDAIYLHAQDLSSSGEVTGLLEGFFCPPEPMVGCLEPQKSSLRIRGSGSASADLIKWKWSAGPAIGYDDLATNDTILCVYDTTGGVTSVATKLAIVAYEGWYSRVGRTQNYANGQGNDYGVTKVRLKAGDAGRTSAEVVARGINVPLPTPYSGSEMFDQDTSVIVQLYQAADKICWSSSFTSARANTSTEFKARIP